MANKYIYTGRLDDESIALYKAESDWLDDYETINGYLRAADIIIQEIQKHYDTYGDTDTAHDQLALPLLNLYIHALEIAFKLLIKRLKKHELHNCCGYKITDTHEKILECLDSHNLNMIINLLNRMLPKKGQIHYFEKFKEINKAVSELYNKGITSANTRYSFDKNGAVTALRAEKINIRIFLVHEDVTNYCRQMLDYLDESIDTDLNECEQNEFTTQKLAELQKCEDNLLKYKKLYTDANDSRPAISTSNPFGVVSVGDISFEDLQHTKEERLLWETLKALTKEELAYLVWGLYFTQPITMNLSHARIMIRDKWQLEEKAFESKKIYDLALEELNKHIMKVKEKIDQIKKYN